MRNFSLDKCLIEHKNDIATESRKKYLKVGIFFIGNCHIRKLYDEQFSCMELQGFGYRISRN